ncbi:hypothetical protein RQM47_16325 [Rubrivirga sp. S365]|uniref:DUF6166 domain-containing protein n=1 Tax=Rubrivirga sp. S365 TaxID=3076080 RepID=UPI0028C7EE04|nr:DUF6166 domain-containing protein [Rubrivirga sp. S365]MDT7858216.1 hypothetical protein [Rubrivirga sp. S365]
MPRPLPDPSDFCPGCARTTCRCRPAPDDDRWGDPHEGASYQAGYDACLADGYDQGPLAEWVYRTDARPVWDGRRVVRRPAPGLFAGLSWRDHHASEAAHAAWFRRQYGLDLPAYLAGHDDAGAGLPSAVGDPDGHARAAADLDAPLTRRCGTDPHAVSPRPGEAPIPMTHATPRAADRATAHTTRTTAGTPVPNAELRAGRLAREAEAWRAFAADRSRMRPSTLDAKAFGACAFSVHHGTPSLAVPSKLVGTSCHQGALAAAARDALGDGWTRLDLRATEGAIEVSHGGAALGGVQPKHAAWVRPLLAHGLGLRLTRVTGGGDYRLGCNVAFVDVGRALARAAARAAEAEPGGAALRLVEPAPPPVTVPVRPEHESLTGEPDDVVLWRTLEGVAHASVPHVVRHSPTGIEWGYLGSGPSDLALSVLRPLVGERDAEALYERFKAEVVGSVPAEGGLLRAADVRAWAEHHGARRRGARGQGAPPPRRARAL